MPSFSNNDDSSIECTITVNDLADLPLLDEKKGNTFQGFLSAINKITLPVKSKELAGIPTEAQYYAFLHPSQDLAEAIKWKSYNPRKGRVNQNQKGTVREDKPNTWGIPSAAIMGAYVYFGTSHEEVLSVNALSLSRTAYDLRFTGPFYFSDDDAMRIRSLNRAQPLILDFYHEVGFVSSAW